MHYIYLLKSTSAGILYIGRTRNVVQRLREHNAGDTFTTRKYRPWTLVYLEGYRSADDAKHREHTIKQFGKVYAQLKRRIEKSIAGAGKVRG